MNNMNRSPAESSLTIGISCVMPRLNALLQNDSLAALPYAKLLVLQPEESGNLPVVPPKQQAIIEKLGIALVLQTQRGLSASRNTLLQHCQTDLLLLADDDITFAPDGIAQAVQWMQAHPEAALLSGQYQKQGQRNHKPYARCEHRHSRRSVREVASVEMMLRISRIPSGVRFDEHFGLGAPFAAGEEALFADRLLKAGAAAYYVPCVLAEHSGASTGDARDEAFYVNRGALLYALDGKLGLLRLPRLLLNQRRRSGLPVTQVARAMLQGFFAARRSLCRK